MGKVVAIAKPKHAGGRPTLYRPEHCDRIIAAMSGGLSAEAAAAKVGISARSLFNWQNEHPEFLQAVQEGRQLALLWWEERATAMAKGSGGNAQIVILALKNRSRAASGWHHDTQRLEHTGPDGSPIQSAKPVGRVLDPASLSPEQLDQLEKILLTAKARE